MSLRRIALLLGKELLYGPKNFLFIFAVVVPVVTSLVVSLVFGTLFSGKPRLGLAALESSQLADRLAQVDFIDSRRYESEAALRQAVEAGAVDMGLFLPAGFDERLLAGETSTLDLLIWGQSLLRHRFIIATAVGEAVVVLTGRNTPAEVVPTILGEGDNTPWYGRLLPLLLLMAILLGGSLVPATALIDEKQKRTLQALTATPTTVADIFLAKGLLGALLSFAVALVTLLLNQAFGSQPGLLLLVLALGAVTAAAFGVLLGAFIRDINTLFAVVKAIGILLYAPAFVYLFPQLPQWLGRIFPTYYIVGPIITITQEGGGWADVAAQLAILLGIIALLLAGAGYAARRLSRQEA